MSSWLTDFFRRNPEYRELPIVRRSRHSVHFRVAPGQVRAYFTIRPMHHDLEFLRVRQWLNVFRQAPRLALSTLAQLPLTTSPLTIQPDATAGLDTMIKSGDANTNFGTYIAWAAGEIYYAGVHRELFKFDLTGLPSAATITSATFSLYESWRDGSNPNAMHVYRQKRAWVEAQATWNIYSTGNNWQTAGGFGADDCEQTDIGSRVWNYSDGINQFRDISLTPTTKADLDLGNGWLVKMNDESWDIHSGPSSDDATPGNRPKLVINYTLASTSRSFAVMVG